MSSFLFKLVVNKYITSHEKLITFLNNRLKFHTLIVKSVTRITTLPQ